MTQDELFRSQVNMPKKLLGRWKGRMSREMWEDALQQGAIALWRAAGDFDPAKGVPFGAYACRRVQWAMWSALRKEGCRSRNIPTVAGADVARLATPPAMSLDEVFDGLTDREKDVCYLRYVQGHSRVETAHILGMTVVGVRNLITSMRRRCRDVG